MEAQRRRHAVEEPRCARVDNNQVYHEVAGRMATRKVRIAEEVELTEADAAAAAGGGGGGARAKGTRKGACVRACVRAFWVLLLSGVSPATDGLAD